MKKSIIRRVAILCIGLAILCLSAAYTTVPVGEKELFIKGKADAEVLAAPSAEEEYVSLPQMVSTETLKTEKAKADAAYQKVLEEAKKQTEKARWVKELKKKYTGKLVAFTFDDGPSKYTEKLLDGLKKRKAHATFMVLGSCASRYENYVQRMIKEGHQVGNHTWSHPNLAKLSSKGIRAELQPTLELIRSMGYERICVVRPPYGAYDEEVKKTAKAPIILWSVDTEDWRHKGDVKTIYNNIMRDAKDGSIILLHDIYGSSVDAALKAMDTLKKEGYQFVTVEELFAIRNVKMKNGTIYYSAPPKDAEK